MRTLVIPKHVFDEIVRSVSDGPRGCETGVTIFGTSSQGAANPYRVVLAVAGPGKRATHEPAHYSGDETHATEIYRSLRSAMPGILWLGELHVHPRGMTWLSHGDRETVQQILTGTDEVLHLGEFIAGVMQRRNGTVDVYPVHFTRECLKGTAMKLRITDSRAPEVQEARINAIGQGEKDGGRSICTESEGSGKTFRETRGFSRMREWWKRHRPYGRARGRRQIHAG